MHFLINCNRFIQDLNVAVVTIIVLIGTISIKWMSRKHATHFVVVGRKTSKLPFAAQINWYRNGSALIHDAYKKFRDEVVQLPATDRQSIILPLRYLIEVSALPHSIASVSQATSDFFMGRWTTLHVGIFGRPTLDAIRSQHISRLSRQLDVDWRPIAVHPAILSIISQTGMRTIVGPEVCRQSWCLKNSTGYARNVFMAATILKFTPAFLQPLIFVLTPYIYRIQFYRHRFFKAIAPYIRQRIELHNCYSDHSLSRPKTEHAHTLDWLIHYSPPDELTPEIIADRLMGVAFGATHTTTNHITNCIFDLAANFEQWAPPLREEIEQFIGSKKTGITSADLSNMWKLDSFMKEVQRLHPPGKLSVNRTAIKSFELSTGEKIPSGVHISFPGAFISLDDSQFKDAKTFDAFRFERLRKDPNTNQHGLRFTSSYAGSLHFGHGRQICPGRFLGSALSKLLIIEILQHYDMKLENGKVRPESVLIGDMIIPNTNYKVLFRSRQ
ncbi:putative cytochrome P450 [Xylaria bambusicola]|uniref:putative cytochrome P450 n=1 Tax=Xylaria bambusicola TaxID=326684 RepID=UPI0020085F43|nr:putative cytochrome P450 [Xylaria bambusicola]KAI0521822.1 putative cytochrome P450 [Xylaria bambusicola]